MKYFLSLMFLVSIGFAQTPTANVPLTFYQSCFGGIDNYHDSARIDNCDFQDGRNFLTYKGYLEKRPGSFRVSNGLKSGYPITFQKEFINASNTDLFLVQASTQIFVSDFGSAFVEITTVNVNGVTDSVSAFGKHFFVNGYNTPWYTTGTDYITISTMPLCRFIAFANERIYCANAAGYESTLYTSAFGDYTDWTIPTDLTADAPTSWTMDAQDGKPLTCLYSSPYGVLAWKRNKMFVVKGFDNDDFYKFRLADNIGCIDQRSIQVVEGKVTWLGEDGVYQWAGGNQVPDLISREIDTTIKQIRQNTANAGQRKITTSEEFSAGLVSDNGISKTWSSIITPGSVVPSTWSHIDTEGVDWGLGTIPNTLSTITTPGNLELIYENFSDNDLDSPFVWTMIEQNFTTYLSLYLYAPYINNTSAYVSSTKSTGTWEFKAYFTEYSSWMRAGMVQSIPTTSNWGEGYRFNLYNGGFGNITKITNGVETNICTGGSATTISYPAWHNLRFERTTSGTFYLYIDNILLCTGADTTYSTFAYFGLRGSYHMMFDDFLFLHASSGTYTSPIFDTSFSTPIGGPFTFSETVPTGTTITYRVAESTSPTGTFTWQTKPNGLTNEWRIPFTKQYWKYDTTLSTDYGTLTPSIAMITLNASSTGTWDSEILYLGPTLTSWGQFNAVTDESTNGNNIFYTRASSNSFTQNSSTPTWVLQPNGLNVTASTHAYYAQVRALSVLTSSTETAQINSITLNWYEGEIKSVASLYFDKNYYLAVNISSTSTSNETTLVLQRTGKWTIFDGLAYGTLGIYDLQPYAGSGLTDSKIWRIMYEGIYYDDNDQAINTYVLTKDFQFDGQNNNKIYRYFYIESYPQTSGTLSLAYSIEKSTTYYTTNQSFLGGTMFNDEIKGMFPGYAKSRYLKFKFSNAIVNEYFKLDAYTLLGEYEKLYRR